MDFGVGTTAEAARGGTTIMSIAKCINTTMQRYSQGTLAPLSMAQQASEPASITACCRVDPGNKKRIAGWAQGIAGFYGRTHDKGTRAHLTVSRSRGALLPSGAGALRRGSTLNSCASCAACVSCSPASCRTQPVDS